MTTTINETIGDRIKDRRETLGLSQEELARMIGYTSRSSINKIETGVQQLRQSKIKDIADALDTNVNYILGVDSIVEKKNDYLARYMEQIKKILADLDEDQREQALRISKMQLQLYVSQLEKMKKEFDFTNNTDKEEGGS